MWLVQFNWAQLKQLFFELNFIIEQSKWEEQGTLNSQSLYSRLQYLSTGDKSDKHCFLLWTHHKHCLLDYLLISKQWYHITWCFLHWSWIYAQTPVKVHISIHKRSNFTISNLLIFSNHLQLALAQSPMSTSWYISACILPAAVCSWPLTDTLGEGLPEWSKRILKYFVQH